jgi:hypothetical protein
VCCGERVEVFTRLLANVGGPKEGNPFPTLSFPLLLGQAPVSGSQMHAAVRGQAYYRTLNFEKDSKAFDVQGIPPHVRRRAPLASVPLRPRPALTRRLAARLRSWPRRRTSSSCACPICSASDPPAGMRAQRQAFASPTGR